MIKKISAIVLALVLCLSVVVMPASALELASGMNVAFELKWDKEYYNPGDTATLSVYMKATDDLELATGSIIIGLNSAQITQADNPVADLKANAVGSDLWNSYWKDPASSQISWLASAIVTRVETANSDAEKGIYDQYMKIVIARNTSGSHANAGSNKNGLPGADINALEEPIITFSYVVSADAAEGTKLNAGITSGSLTCSPAQTAFKYYSNPGNATTAPSVAASTIDVTSAAAESTIGEPSVDLILGSANREQIKFDKDLTTGEYAGTFAYRTFVELVNLEEVFGDAASADNTDAGMADNTYITEAGYVVTAGTLDEAGAKAYVEGTGSLPSAHVADDSAYISTSYISGKYVMALTITNIPDADKTASLGGLAYVKYMQNGTEKVAYFTITSQTFSGLYDTYKGQAFPTA